MSTTTTIRLPGESINIVREAVKGELGADCAELPNMAEDVTEQALARGLKSIESHRALLDAIGWEDAALTDDVTVTCDGEYLKAALESAMSSASDHIAEAVGEYRNEKAVDPEWTMGFVKQLECLIEAWATVDRNLEEELVVA
jgi:hypothetical protein